MPLFRNRAKATPDNFVAGTYPANGQLVGQGAPMIPESSVDVRIPAKRVSSPSTFAYQHGLYETNATPPAGVDDAWEPPRPDFDHPQRPSMYWSPGVFNVPPEVWDYQPAFQDNTIYPLLGWARPNPDVQQSLANAMAASGRLGGLLPNALGNRGNLPRGYPADTMSIYQPGIGMGDYW